MVRPDDGGATLAEARALFAANEWRRCATLLTADAETALSGEELLLLGRARHLIGDDEGAVAAFARAYGWLLDRDDARSAVQAAFGAGIVLENARENVRADAWVARAGELVERYGLEGPEKG